MFLLVPDPSPLDPQLRGLWDWLQQRVEQCPSTLPDSVLSELVDTLLTRVQCSAASREEVIPIALALTESFMYQVRGHNGAGCFCSCASFPAFLRSAVKMFICQPAGGPERDVLRVETKACVCLCVRNQNPHLYLNFMRERRQR